VLRIGSALGLLIVTVALATAVTAAVRGAWVPAFIGAGAVVALVALGAVAPDGHEVGTIDVALVQGGGPQGTRAEETNERLVFDRHLAATAEVRLPVDLVLWPENVVNVEGPVAATREGDELLALARTLDAPIVAGVVEGDDDRFHNAAVVIEPDGSFGDRFEKVHRVPFGEFVPFRPILEPIAGDALISRDALVGDGPATLDTPVGRVGVAISWEVFFPQRARDGVGHGGRILLNPTNGASFTGTIVQTQQVASSRMRAIETGRWVLQAAPTGFTAIVRADGTVVVRTSISEALVLQATVGLREGDTIATRFGQWPAIAIALLCLAGGWAIERRGRSSG
jgi:apolipoprotein N-acyltransferase